MPETGRTDGDRRVFACLREIHAAAHRWQTELSGTPDLAGLEKRRGQVKAIVDRNLAEMRQVLAGDVVEREWGAGLVVELELRWASVENLWAVDPAKAEETMKSLVAVRAELDQIVYLCLTVTMTPDINDRMGNLEVGQPLDLKFVFGGGLPKDEELCKRLVLEVAQERGAVANGWFDAEAGLMYRVAATAGARRRSLWVLAALLGLGAGVASWFGTPTLANYGALMAGAGFHTLIDALKQKRAKPATAFTAMDNWPLWLHVHQWPVAYSILWAQVGFALITASTPELDARAAFVAGYGIDSITELFVNRFAERAEKAAQALAK